MIALVARMKTVYYIQIYPAIQAQLTRGKAICKFVRGLARISGPSKKFADKFFIILMV
jgi:hypothetical protein